MRTGEGARGRETCVFNSPGEELASYWPCGENTKTALKYQQLYPPRGGAVKVTGTRRGAIWTWGGPLQLPRRGWSAGSPGKVHACSRAGCSALLNSMQHEVSKSPPHHTSLIHKLPSQDSRGHGGSGL